MAPKATREVLVEPCGDLKLLIGGKQGYARVRGGVGKGGRQFQGYTINKKNSTAAFDSPRAAAIALAALERDLAAGLDKAARKAKRGAARAPFVLSPSLEPSFPYSSSSHPHHISSVCCACRRIGRCDHWLDA